MKNMKHIVVAIFALSNVPGAVTLHSQDQHPTKEVVQPKRLSRHELFSEDHTADVVAIQQLWGAYQYYNDTHNGPGIESLFAPDAVLHFVSNNRGEINPGRGCPIVGIKDIAAYFGYSRTAKYEPEIHDGLPFPGNSHHYSANILVKVNDDGKTAMLTAATLFTVVSDNPDRMALPDGKGSRIGTTGEYRIFLRKTSEGWMIVDFYDAGDPRNPITTPAKVNPSCDSDSPPPSSSK
jgi:hypothetical protein